jgi:hypothetical protein
VFSALTRGFTGLETRFRAPKGLYVLSPGLQPREPSASEDSPEGAPENAAHSSLFCFARPKRCIVNLRTERVPLTPFLYVFSPFDLAPLQGGCALGRVPGLKPRAEYV